MCLEKNFQNIFHVEIFRKIYYGRYYMHFGKFVQEICYEKCVLYLHRPIDDVK